MWGLHAPLAATHNHHGPVLILAFEEAGWALFVCDDGQLRRSALAELRSEWRYNWNTHEWEDFERGLDDEASDGGPEVPGDVPEPDRADGSDPGDEGDAAAGSVVPE